jgi:hypothetical protein
MVTFEVESRQFKGTWVITDFENEDGAAREKYKRRIVSNSLMKNPYQTRLMKRIMTIEEEVLEIDEPDTL